MLALGTLYDPELKSESAESVYDIITSDMRRIGKLATYRGIGECDILDSKIPNRQTHHDGTDLDSFYRRCLMQGLEYHNEQGRGYLPAGLIEEVKALTHPPIPWDVELAQWFDGHFAPLEKIRSYAKPSRRQSGSPNIPRPQYVPLWGAEENRTFGVVLDTSGSMERHLLARVLGTILQPGINLLQKADDFPKDGPILIITDGGRDKLSIKRKHAFLIPANGRLPFTPRGQLFRVQ